LLSIVIAEIACRAKERAIARISNGLGRFIALSYKPFDRTLEQPGQPLKLDRSSIPPSDLDRHNYLRRCFELFGDEGWRQPEIFACLAYPSP